MNPAPNTPESIAFGRFRLLPHRRLLLADDQPIKLGGRALDLLMALIETPGVVVSKDALTARVWPGRAISEANLQLQISALRNALGAERDLVRTVAGRGYQFTGEIHRVSTGVSPVASRGIAEPFPAGSLEPVGGASEGPTNLPQQITLLIGRDAELEELTNLVAARRFVTLTGAGGIGKTRLALAA